MTPVCRNCGAVWTDRYCPSCGQRGDERRGPLLSLAGDALSELFSLDGRHLRTAAALLAPGRLTRAYLDGRRASFASPVRVYLVASLLLFFVIDLSPPDADEVNLYVDDVLVGREEPAPGLRTLQLSFDSGPRSRAWAEPLVEAKRAELRELSAQQLLDRLYARLERSLPTALIALVPLVAAGLKLLYRRRDLYYVDHLVFALHFQSFLFLALVAARLLAAALPADWLPPLLLYLIVLLVVAPVYLLLALRRLHRQSWPATLLKTAAVGLLYLATLSLVAGATSLYVVRTI